MKRKIPVLQLKENISGMRVDRFSKEFVASFFDDVSQLHRNDHFIIMFLLSGAAELLVDFKKVQVVTHKLIFLFPGQIQRVVKVDQNSDGWVMFLDNKLIDENTRLIIEDSLFKDPALMLSESDVLWFARYFELLFQTYHDYGLGVFQKPALKAFALPCLCKIASGFQAETDTASIRYSLRKVEVTKNFKNLVRAHFRELKKPGDYAKLMNFSISYLNDTIKLVTGFTTTYFIQQEMLREAQRLLCYTDLSVKEIAIQLWYDDTKYFNRVFSKLAGMPPGKFRNSFKSLMRK